MKLLELRDQWRHSETSKNDWIRLCASISEETKTAHIVSTKNSTLIISIKIYLLLKRLFLKWNITSSPYLEMLFVNIIKLLFLLFSVIAIFDVASCNLGRL